ncbi:MAG: hypothetical protein JST82_12470 [Bacteroidetes bacterium]|nr:hypothetical protein [Bacteroidota bacterium]
MLRDEYSDDLILKDALQLYFSKYHFENGGYHWKWFKIKLGPIFIPLPNIKARVDAVKIHDIHHIINEYPATWSGEVEIGAWELAGGCGRFWVGWLLNAGSFFIGMFLYPKALFKAFMKGRRCTRNFNYDTEYNDVLLNKTVGELRVICGVNNNQANTAKDYVLFVLCCILTAAYHIGLLMAFCWILESIYHLFMG